MENTDTKEVVKNRKKKYVFFIGIDVSKNELDYAVMKGKQLLFHEEQKNEPEQISYFLGKLKKIEGFTMAKAIFCMEQTGFYCNFLLESLCRAKANVVLENPIQIKLSLGIMRGKDDKADALRIATYVQRNHEELRLWSAKRPILIELKNLAMMRDRLLSLSLALSTPLKEADKFVKKILQQQNEELCRRSSDAIRMDLEIVDECIDGLIHSDPRLKRLKELITSVPGIGKITAVQMILTTNEFKDISNPKKFACYAGVAPFKKESGLKVGRARVSKFANKKMKVLLHLCAISAITADMELRAYFLRKTQGEGKPKLLVVNAMRYKLILRIFACVKQDRGFIKNYHRGDGIKASELSSAPGDES